jgi:tetratricopeptide (TPR) repeat protein
MSEHFISRADAESDLLSAAAYLAESIPHGETHAAAIATVVPRYLETGNVDLAAELANSVDDPFSRDRLLVAVAAKCAELDDDEYALQLVEAIEDPGSQSRGYEQVGIAKADKGQFEKAEDVAALMIHPDAILARVAIRQAAAGDENAALETIGQIEFPRDAVVSYLNIAAANIADGNSEKAIEILSQAEAKAAEIEHDEERIRTLCEVGTLFVDAGDKSRAFNVFERARNDAEELDSNRRDALLAHVAIGFLNTGSVDAADRMLDVVTDKTQIASVLLSFARDHWRKEEKDEAIEALDEAFAILRSQHESETRNSREKFVLMGTIAAQFAGFERAEQALEAAESIIDPPQQVNALSQIAAVFAEQKNEAMAREAIAALESSDRVFALIGMSDTSSESDAALSETFLREADSGVDEIETFGPRSEALMAIAERQLRRGQTEKFRSSISKALAVAGEMRDDAARVNVIARTASLHESAGLEVSTEDLTAVRAMLGHEDF